MGGLRSMARGPGVSETQAARGAATLAPAILGGMKKQSQARPACGKETVPVFRALRVP